MSASVSHCRQAHGNSSLSLHVTLATALCVVLVFLVCIDSATAFPSNTPSIPQRRAVSILSATAEPKGCAAKPYEKKKVAVFGAGGYLGATTFGFLQRASSLYGTGFGGTPRAMVATSIAAMSLNRILGRTFKLAFAGEDSMRLTNMQDVDAIQTRLKGMDAAVLGTVYHLESRPITGNTYERNPNDKTLEFFLDSPKMTGGWPDSGGGVAAADDNVTTTQVHLTLFRNTIQACRDAGLQHIVVVETPQTLDSKPFASILDEFGIPFTYVFAKGDLGHVPEYTFEKGIQCDLEIRTFTFDSKYKSADSYNAGDWMDSFLEERGDNSNGSSIIPREDVAAIIVQSLMSLDWQQTLCLEVSSNGRLLLHKDKEKLDKASSNPWPIRSDRDWCVNSNIVADKLASIT